MLESFKNILFGKEKKSETLLDSDDLYKLDFIAKHSKCSKRQIIKELINERYNVLDKPEVIENDVLFEDFIERLDNHLAETLDREKSPASVVNKSIIWCNEFKGDVDYNEYRFAMINKMKELFVIPTHIANEKFKELIIPKDKAVQMIKEVIQKYE